MVAGYLSRSAVVALFVGSTLAVPVSGQSSGAQPFGIVNQISGPWKLVQSNLLLARGQMILNGQSITIGTSTIGSVSIAIFGRREKWEKTCTQAAQCQGSYRLSSDVPTSASRFWKFFVDFWTPDRAPQPVLLGSRSADAAPNPALLDRTEATVDLRPALEQVAAGSYEITITPLAGSGSLGRPAWQGKVSVAPGQPSTIPAVPAGLYQLTLSSGGSSTTVLILDGPVPDLRAAWVDAQTMARTWTGVSEVTIEAFLVRALYSIDAQRKRP